MTPLCTAALATLLLACQPAPPITPPVTQGAFGSPEMVTIRGYPGPAQDPILTSDGRYLLWDSHSDDPSIKGDIYCAAAIDYKTFAYVGPIKIEGQGDYGRAAPAIDDAGNFYFLTNRFDVRKDVKVTIAHGGFADCAVTGVTAVVGISVSGGNMGAIPSRDGRLLVFSDNSNNTSVIVLAQRNADGSFTRLPNSDNILKTVNGTNQHSYTASLSPDLREIFFTSPPSIYVARRPTADAPFGASEALISREVAATAGHESPNLAADGKRLYYHRVTSPSHADVWVMTR